MGSKESKGVAVAFDFSTLHEPQCKNPELAGTAESDYELWSPNDGRAGSKCLMGRTVVYQRRKPEAECYNGQEFDRSSFRESCICTEEDYECDIGYFREGKEPCRPIPNAEQAAQACLPGEEFYEIPTGYRRVAGNTCNRGVSDQYDPVRVACSISSLSSTAYFLLLVMGLIAVGYGVATHTDQLQEIWGRLVKAYGEVKYTRNFNDAADTVDDDMMIREPTDTPKKGRAQRNADDDFNPRE
jgi:hypothetical protein